MKALVVGAAGMLGRALVAELPARGYAVTPLARAECDLRDVEALRAVIAREQPTVVFNAAAFTDVDRAEDEPDEAFRVNALAPEAMARACAAIGAKLVHYSTDFVFDGELERAYDEFDPPTPQGVYARSKVAGERLAAAAAERVFVVRTGCLYGRGGRNFPSTILRRLRAGETIRADASRLGSPTWVPRVVETSIQLAASSWYGLYHATAEGETSWADYARFLASQLALSNARIEALPTSALSLKAPRPRRAVLDKRMLRLRGFAGLGDWRDHARGFIAAETA